MKAPQPGNESERLDALRHYHILDTLPEPEFDELTRLASQICEAPIALISLVDEHRQWFKSRVGLEAAETHRDLAFCAFTILQDEPLMVDDATKDARFSDNPLVTSDPNIRFYFGVPLTNPEGFSLGTLCVIDRVPRHLTPQQIFAVKVLGRQVMSQIELRVKMRHMADLVQQTESANTELERSNRDLAEFASAVSHDLQTPLRQVTILGEWLKEDCAGQVSQEGQDYIERMGTAIKSMQNLLVDLMDYSRVTMTASPHQKVDLMKIIQEVVSGFEVDLKQMDGRVEVNQMPSIEADATQMMQLFQNLIGNAIKFHRDGVAPVVQIQAEVMTSRKEIEETDDLIGHGPWCRILVQDNGIGIKDNHCERIFRIFKRLHGPQRYEGTGVGLAICRRVAERHGGVIKARSTVGQGTTFIITLPMQQNAKHGDEPGQLSDRPAA